jgi:DNA modification methylase
MTMKKTNAKIGSSAASDNVKQNVVWVPIEELKPYGRNARTHDDKQLAVIAASITTFGFTNPVLVDKNNIIVAGHGRVAAAKRLGYTDVPTLLLDSLTPEQVIAYRIADNRIAELAGWDQSILTIEYQHLVDCDVEFDLEVTGFTMAEIDIHLNGSDDDSGDDANDPADEIPEEQQFAVSRIGDLWLMKRHRLLCGSALEAKNFSLLMKGQQAQMILQDPPWNISMDLISGSGKIKHRQFVMASGEMTDDEFRAFLRNQLTCNMAAVDNDAIIQVFIDWRGVEKVITAGATLGLELVNICVWSKTNGGMGSPWRSAHELVVVFKKPGGKIRDRVKLGRHGRYRTNVWHVAGQNSFGSGRMEALKIHPTSKPVALLAEAIRDVTDIGDIVLDSFMGSGSLLIAAERTQRIAYGMELDPLYVDTIVRRWEQFTGEKAVHAETGLTFAEVTEQRDGDNSESPPAATACLRDRTNIPPRPTTPIAGGDNA